MRTGRDRVVRPYAVTRGRTKGRRRLELEALVSSVAPGGKQQRVLTPEYQAIVTLCRSVRSVAEISALIRMPLGVVRVLVGDMADEGLVKVHEPALAEGPSELNLLERVLSGLRRL
nr:DUF742 domain-containing protein [Rhizohabitans arisaemae]